MASNTNIFSLTFYIQIFNEVINFNALTLTLSFYQLICQKYIVTTWRKEETFELKLLKLFLATWHI
jgi:hypothetical protein